MYETELEDEDFLELEDEVLETEDEDFLELEDEASETEDEDFLGDLLELEDEDFLELEDEASETEDEDFLGDLVSSALGAEMPSPLNEALETELATELLEVQSEEELEDFLGNLIKKAAKGVSSFAKSSAGKALGGVLKNIAKTALPMVGGALGTMVAPGLGTTIGSRLGSAAGDLFEMEEEVPHEELELELARRVVKIGATAANHAARAHPRVPPAALARRAVIAATRAHAPMALRRGVQPRFRGRRPAGIPYRRVVVGRRPVARRVVRPVGYRRPGHRPVHRGGAYRGVRRRPIYRAGGYRAPARRSIGGAVLPGAYRAARPVVKMGPGARRVVVRGGGAYPTWGSGGWGGQLTATGRWVRRGNTIIVLGA